MADVKYPDYTPVDEPVRKGFRPKEPGSGIRVDKKPVNKDDDTREALQKFRAEKKGISVEQMRKDMSDEYDRKMKAGEFYKKGGSASSRADGIAIRGKTRGKMIMCGGGYAKGKK